MRYRINSPKVIHQIFDTEVVIVNLESGNYYSISGSGIDIWRQLAANRARDEILKSFDANAETVARFLDELAREELVIEAAEELKAGDAARPGPFVKPALDKFTDMRDLLLLDPIHELDESGWPKNLPPVEEK